MSDQYKIISDQSVFSSEDELCIHFPELGFRITLESKVAIPIKDIERKLLAAAGYMNYYGNGMDGSKNPTYAFEVTRPEPSDVGGIPLMYGVGRESGSYTHGPLPSILDALKICPEVGDFIYALPEGRAVYRCLNRSFWEKM